MSSQFDIDIESDDYYVLSNSYPAPFMASLSDNDSEIRWRTVEHYILAMSTSSISRRREISRAITVDDAINLVSDTELSPKTDNWDNIKSNYIEIGMLRKFEQNPRLKKKLLSLSKYNFISKKTPDADKYLKKLIKLFNENKLKQNNPVFTNLLYILHSQGYNYLIEYNPALTIEKHLSIPINIIMNTNQDITYKAPTGILSVKINIAIYALIFDKPLTENDKDISTRKIAILEVNTGEFNDKNMMNYIDKKHGGPANPSIAGSYEHIKAYYIIHQFDKSKYIKMINKLRDYNEIVIYTPSFLQIRPSDHFMSPSIRIIKSTPPNEFGEKTPETIEYEHISYIRDQLGAISSEDPLIKEKNLKLNDIIFIDDFSPHYRIVN